MAYDQEIQEILDNLKVFEKMYELIRFVNPLSKKVVNYVNNNVSELTIRCFDFWGKNAICENCISMRAFNENLTFVKIEYTSGNIYMITAIPVELPSGRIVIELMKDITNSMVFGDGNYENNAQIYSMIDTINNIALKDDLTGVYNRRYINEKLPIDLINSALLDQDIAIIMADIDFFKKVNDTYGHLSGDCTLKSLASTLSSCLKRDSDWVARYGGEEFLVCLPGAGISRAVEIAEDMRKAVEAQIITCGQHQINITASFGVCVINPTQGYTVEDAIAWVDKRLYAAKNNGRNRVEWE